jgi:uncharacterized protein
VSAERPATTTESGAAPGWHPTAYGWQWWDGRQWYPPQPASSGVDEKTLAMLSHLGPLFGGFVLPLVMFLIAKGKPYLRHHACEALNFAITHFVASIVAMVVFFVGLAASTAGGSDPGVAFGITAGLGMLLLLAVSFGGIAFGIIGAVKAFHLEWWRYPINIRLVKP